MHNNYYFLRQLTKELAPEITGFTLVSCFSQNKDELVVEFNNERRSIFIKATLLTDFQCLSFPATYHRARKNSIDLFNELLMKKVTGVRQFENERSLGLQLEDGHTLVFKMHGSQSNVIWFRGNIVSEIFRNNFPSDLELRLDQLDRSIDWSHEAFAKHQADLQTVYYTFGKAVWRYLEEKGFSRGDLEQRWKLLTETLRSLDAPKYYLHDLNGVLSLSLFPSGQTIKTFHRPAEALNEFFTRKISTTVFQKEKASLLAHLQGKIKQSESYQAKNRRKLEELTGDTHYRQWADLVMANLHLIKPGQDRIVVANFFDDQRPVEIKLRAELSPQKNAEVFYRKGKNQAIEIKLLQESLARKDSEIRQLQEWERAVHAAETSAALKEVSVLVYKDTTTRERKISLPYHEFEKSGFRIWVGKNAVGNDTLTLRHSYKEDLWLHAKDVAGSHVLIKYQSGKTFPKDVIERAAELAAYYSKRKNEKLCPVAVTPKKYVRKRKGDPAGAVVVEREEVMMVEPRK